MTAAYSAYVPCRNNRATVRAAVASVLAQQPPPAEVLLVDDGSTDDPAAEVSGLPVRVVRHEAALGRGAARARAWRELGQAFVLGCDATNVLPAGFAARALRWMEDGRVAAAFGPLRDPAPQGAVARWRARHLFKQHGPPGAVRRRAGLATYGTLLRRSAVDAAGGFDPTLRQAEDADLGRRLLATGVDVVFDPELAVLANVRNTLAEVLERYWRWNAGIDGSARWRDYGRNLSYALHLAGQDLRERDPVAAGVSLLVPHYCFWRSRRLAPGGAGRERPGR